MGFASQQPERGRADSGDGRGRQLAEGTLRISPAPIRAISFRQASRTMMPMRTEDVGLDPIDANDVKYENAAKTKNYHAAQVQWTTIFRWIREMAGRRTSALWTSRAGQTARKAPLSDGR